MIGGIVRDFALGLLLIAAPLVTFLVLDRRVVEGRVSSEHAAVAVRLGETLEAERARATAALRRFCRDDLALDAWLLARGGGDASGAEPALRRSTEVIASSIAFFDAVIVFDSTRDRMRGRVLAGAGERVTPAVARTRRAEPLATPGAYAGALLERVSSASNEPFAIDTHGTEEPGLAWVARCTATRDGVSATIAGLTQLDGAAFAERLAVPASTWLLVERAGATIPDPAFRRDARWRRIADVIDGAGRPAATIALAREPEAPFSRRREALLAAFGVGGVLALVVALTSGRRRRRGLLLLERAADRVGQGDLDSTLDGPLSRELRPTATAFGRMTDELQKAQARLRRAERIAAWRDIARALAHELKNPLSPIQVSIESLRKAHARKLGELDEIFEESTAAILEEVARMKRTLDEFTRFARVPPPRPEPVDLREIAEHVAHLHERDDVSVRVESPPAPVVVRADREQITQVLVNLVQNALDAVRSVHPEGGGHVVVALEPGEAHTTIAVRDDGPGVPVDRRATIFEPYVTGKPGGTGLGLAIVHRMIAEHGGTIDVGTSPEGGASFEVILPNAGPIMPADASLSADALPPLRRDGANRPM